MNMRLALFAFVLSALPFALAAAEDPQHLKLSAVKFNEVKVEDQFWSARLKTNREQSLPHNFKWCEQTGRISNFLKAGKVLPGKFEGLCFNDSDVFKVLEGASYSLADRRDPALEKTVDEVIAKIAAAQQPDGYLNTYFTLVQPKNRWANLKDMHELYCAGHMIEGAVAHWRATGKRTFLDVAVKYADYIDRTFGPGKKIGTSGHEEIELALVKLYQATGEKRYLDLARFFIDVRGDNTKRKTWGPYHQDHMPVRQQSEIVGHAVRAMYLYAGVADVAAYSGDRELIAAMDRLWKSVVAKKLYITGGIGARHEGEAFGADYELPNDSAYCETCAAIGLALWAHRLNLMHGDAQYADVLEQCVYNGILSGIALDGQRFFYVNPLASAGKHHRQPFYGCACCPTNVVRFVPSVPGYIYAVGRGGDPAVYVNLYASSTTTVNVAGRKVKLTQKTDYPWDGKVRITVEPEGDAKFALRLRIPGWRQGAKLTVAGQAIEKLDVDRGYARIERNWKSGDVVELDLPMPIERIETHPKVKADAGRVAVRRGPIVYCFEDVDNPGAVANIALPADPKFTARHDAKLLGGVTVIEGVDRGGHKITAVPYYAWDHRAAGPMAVWVRQEGKSPAPSADDPAWGERLYRPLDSEKPKPAVQRR